jgi:uncharacterized delta-60 repeat protein
LHCSSKRGVNYIHSITSSVNTLRLATVLFVLSVLFALPANAKPGDTDKSFGVNGLVTVALDTTTQISSSGVASVHSLPDGRTLLVGACFMALGGMNIPCLARLTASGHPDLTFNSTGRSTSPRNGFMQQFGTTASVLEVGGATSILGVETRYFERVSAAGQFDPATNGLPTHPNIFSWGSKSILRQGDKLIVGGYCLLNGDYPNNSMIVDSGRYCLLRYGADGTVDSSFGSGGLAELPMTGRDLSLVDISRVTLDAAARPLAAYPCAGTCVVRWTESGQLDTGFGTNGIARFPIGYSFGTFDAGTSAVLVQKSGRILVTGGCQDGTGSTTSAVTFCVVAFDSTGNVDPTFGTAGLQQMQVDSALVSSYSTDARVASDDSFFLVGYCTDKLVGQAPRIVKLCLTAHNSNGTLRSEFGTAGKLVFADFKSVSPRISLDGRGRVVIGTECGTYPYLCLLRIHGKQSRFDLDNDNESLSETDAILYLRHLLGFRGAALTTGAFGTYADRTSATDIATYLSTPNPTYPNCSASIVGAPGGPQAMLDGIVLLRAMMGLNGDAVTNGIAFPAGTARTSWVDIRAHLNGNCGMVLN